MKNLFLVMVTFLLLSSFAFADDAGLPVTYRLKNNSMVSMNIYNSDGQVVRELMHAIPRNVGPNRDFWDGLDNDGKPVPTGNYTWKLLATPGLKAEYLMCPGNNYPNDPNDWRNRAPGTHGGPCAVAIDDGGIYSAASCTENIENYLLKMDKDGKKRIWSATQHVAWTGGMAMASDNGTLYVLGNNREIWPYNAETGKLSTAIKILLNEELPLSISARGGVLAICYPKNNKVAWADPVKKTIIDSVEINAPVDAALAADGAIIVLTKDTIYQVNKADKTSVKIVEGLTDANHLDVDKNTGDILVSEQGKSQQIKRFSKDGKLLAAYGKVGGRQDGIYHPEDFKGVADIACDGAGGFLVSEPNDAPRRTAYFDKNGKLIREWYGGQTWACWVFPEPGNPNAIWMNSSWTDMMRLEVDYKNKSWKVHSVYHYAGMAGGLVGGNGNAANWEGRMRNGELYLCRSGSDPCVIRVDKKKWQLMPVTLTGTHIKHYKSAQSDLIKEMMGDNDAYQWNDANGDGMPQKEEFTFYPSGGLWHALSTVDDNLNYQFIAGNKVQQFPVKSWTADGVPQYGAFPDSETALTCPPRVTSIEGRWGSYIGKDTATGATYGAFNDRVPDWGRSKDSFLTKWDAAGKQQWTVGRLGDAAGEVWRPFRRMAGVAHNCPVFTGFSYEWPSDGPTATYVWDADGLWVGGLFDNPDLKAADEQMYSLGAEALSAAMYTEKNGDVLFYGCWLNEARVYRITGWNNWQRENGKLTIINGMKFTASQPAWQELPPAKGTGLKGEYFANDQYNPAGLKLTRVDPIIDFTWGVWDKPDFKTIPEIGKQGFSIRWTGKITPRVTGLFAFRSSLSSIAKVKVDGMDFRDPGSDRVKGRYRVKLEAGKQYDIEIKYSTWMTHPTLTHGVILQWLAPGHTTWETVPTSQLMP